MNDIKLTNFIRFFEEINIKPIWLRKNNTYFPYLRYKNNINSSIKLTVQKQQLSIIQLQKVAQFIFLPLVKNYLNFISRSINKTHLTSLEIIPILPYIKNNSCLKLDLSIVNMNWSELKKTVSNCQKCALCHNRKHTVFGIGNKKGKWLFIGEGPGFDEDQKGEPFIGQAGKLLDNMLLSIGLKRNIDVYITNIVKCRPIGKNYKDRPPSQEEIVSCMPYLERQISLIQPSILIALGKTAALSLLKLDNTTSVKKLRGIVHQYNKLPLVVTYHPAYLLRQLNDKSKTWEDLCLAKMSYFNNYN